MDPRRFGPSYQEHVHLRDGTRVCLRLVGPADKALLLEGFARLSPDSRYRRFFSPKASLSAADLRYFTEVDGERHLAIGATRTLGHDHEEGLGVARFVRVPGEATVAEAAVAVVDDWQRRGLGKLLLSRLVMAARERGITHFRVTSLAENAAVRALLDEVGEQVLVSRGDGALSLDVALPELPVPAEHAPEGVLYRLFRDVARGVARILGPHG